MTLEIAGVHRDSAFYSHLDKLVSEGFASRLFAKDATLWGPAAEAEAAVRLGWTDFGENATALIAETVALRKEFAAAGVDRFVLCGMGGSSLAPLVIAPSLTVIDSTHPETVRGALTGDLSRTAVVVGSKSGSTIETLSHRAAFEAAFTAAGIQPAERMVFVTDPGSALERAAHESGMRYFLADPNVGGRFSALTAYGIVPSVLAGADLATLVHDAAAAREYLREDDASNPALIFAAAVAADLPKRFVLGLHTDASLPAAFGLWIEQLVAESTGKDGLGVLPIAEGPPSASDMPSSPLPKEDQDLSTLQRHIILSADTQTTDTQTTDASARAITVTGRLGEQMLLWEVMTTALAFIIKVDPFNQPDVEAAKVEAREMLGSAIAPTSYTPDFATLLANLRDFAQQNSYLTIQAYADSRNARVADLLQELRVRLSRELSLPVALGWGPRYLHSTGQLHKGGPAAGVFLQLIDTGFEDLSIPGSKSSFGDMLYAQAQGDAAVLRVRGRPVITVATDSVEGYLRALLSH